MTDEKHSEGPATVYAADTIRELPPLDAAPSDTAVDLPAMPEPTDEPRQRAALATTAVAGSPVAPPGPTLGAVAEQGAADPVDDESAADPGTPSGAALVAERERGLAATMVAGGVGRAASDMAGSSSAPRRRRGLLGRLGEFFFLWDRFAALASRKVAFGSGDAVALARAADARVAAVQLLSRDAQDARRHVESAITLAREAVRLAVSAHVVAASARGTLLEVGAEPETVAEALGPLPPEALRRWRRALHREAVATDPPAVEDLQEDLVALRAVTDALTEPILRPTVERWRLRGVRLMRWALVVGLVAGSTLGGWRAAVAAHRGPNFALGARVETSSNSKYAEDPRALVDGSRSGLGVHTEREQDPWAIVDLGRERTIGRFVVVNRDTYPDRSIPLRVEVSTDREAWQQLGERKEVFRVWDQPVPATRARYVRLQSPRRTFLQLNELELYAR